MSVKTNIDEIQAKLQSLLAKIETPDEALRNVGEILVNNTRDRLERGVDIYGSPFKPLSALTVSLKSKNKDKIRNNYERFVKVEWIDCRPIEEAIKDDPNNSIEKQIKKAEEDIKDNEALINSSGNSNNYTTMLLEITNKKELIIGATYEEIFSKYLVDPLTGGKRTFLRPNRRQHGNKSSLKIPGRSQRKGTKNRLKHLTYALDVSGSISHKQATQFHQSVWTIKELLNPTKLTVLFFNTQIVLEKTFSDVEPYTTIEVRGSGGTCLRDVYAKTRQLDSEALVIFTDMQVQIPPEPDWDTIWLVPDKRARIKPDLYGEIYLIPDHKQ